MKRTIFVALALVLSLNCLCAQAIPQKDTQWEYIVVSFGKTVFGIPEKTMAYKAVGIGNGNESTSLQSNLDILGRFGWEVVGFIGQIGGDQQIVLKRKYDKSRSADEFSQIENGKELYMKDLMDIAERAKRIQENQEKANLADSGKTKLIDLDEVDRIQKRAALLVALTDYYQKRFAIAKVDAPMSFEIHYENRLMDNIVINISYDLTPNYLIAGNSYRQSLVDGYLKSIGEKYRIKDPRIERYASVKINIKGFIVLNGDNVLVASYSADSMFGSW